MNTTLVIGHKNPDTDSICSSYCYAHLKNLLDQDNTYEPGRCGNLNRQTKFVFDTLGVAPPKFYKDIHPRVSDIMTENVVTIDANEPVFRVMKNIDELKIRISPVVADNRFLGIVSMIEMANFFIPDDVSRKPEYLFRIDNFPRVLKGRFLKSGVVDEFFGELVIGAMPFERSVRHLAALSPQKTVLVVGKRSDIIAYAVEKQLPAIVITGAEPGEHLESDIDFSSYEGWVFLSEMETAETFRRLMLSTPTKSIMYSGIPSVSRDDYVEHARDILMKIDHRGLPVLSGDSLVGIITRSDLLKKKQKKLILMDHNEPGQAIDGAEAAEICEIIDHHRLGVIKTRTPIYVYAKPVGSTCTLVYQLYKINGVLIERDIASLLLAGILSDTAILRSPTTTREDVVAVDDCARLSGLNPDDFGIEIFRATESIKMRDPESVVTSDFKIYREFNVGVGIGQAEVVTLDNVYETRDALLPVMNKIAQTKGLAWVMLLVTDIVKQDSILLATDFPEAERHLGYARIDANIYSLPGVLSRKKQLLPEILRVLEEMSGERP